MGPGGSEAGVLVLVCMEEMDNSFFSLRAAESKIEGKIASPPILSSGGVTGRGFPRLVVPSGVPPFLFFECLSTMALTPDPVFKVPELLFTFFLGSFDGRTGEEGDTSVVGLGRLRPSAHRAAIPYTWTAARLVLPRCIGSIALLL